MRIFGVDNVVIGGGIIAWHVYGFSHRAVVAWSSIGILILLYDDVLLVQNVMKSYQPAITISYYLQIFIRTVGLGGQGFHVHISERSNKGTTLKMQRGAIWTTSIFRKDGRDGVG